VLQLKLARRVIESYVVAASVEEAVSHLSALQGEARVLAGGTDLMPQVQRGELRASHLVDVSQIAALRKLTVAADEIHIGAAVSLARLASHDKLMSLCWLLPEAARAIGTRQVKRLATVGGNVACGWGNSEVALSLLALDAEAEVNGYMGPQWVPVRSLYAGGGLSRLDATHEVLSAVRFRPLDQGQGSALSRLNTTDGPQRAALVGVVIVALDASDAQAEWPLVDWAVVALGVEKSAPRRYVELEGALSGAPLPIATGLLADGVRDAVIELDSEHPARQRLDEAVATMSAGWERACQRARGVVLS